MKNIFFQIRNIMSIIDFKTIKRVPFGQRELYMFGGDVLNITYITSSNRLSLSFNLELITKSDADKHVAKLKQHIYFDTSECVDHPLDYNVVCSFPNTETDDNILNALREVFHIEKL